MFYSLQQIKGNFVRELTNIHRDYWTNLLLSADQYTDVGREKKLKNIEKEFFMELPRELTEEEVAASEEISKRLDQIDADEAEELLAYSSRRMVTDKLAYDELLTIVGDAQEAR